MTPLHEEPRLSRQAFLKEAWRGALSQAVAPLWPSPPQQNPRQQNPALLRPPGAVAEPLFLERCTRCDACTAACPHEVISVHYGSGEPWDGTPELANLRDHPCRLCADLPCIAACPTEALMPVTSLLALKMGEVRLEKSLCTAYGENSGCRACYDICPVKDLAIELVDRLPVIDAAACIGCGLCEHACPPGALVVLPA